MEREREESKEAAALEQRGQELVEGRRICLKFHSYKWAPQSQSHPHHPSGSAIKVIAWPWALSHFPLLWVWWSTRPSLEVWIRC